MKTVAVRAVMFVVLFEGEHIYGHCEDRQDEQQSKAQ
jgi:hypothetical protein